MRAYVATAALLLALAGCSAGDEEPKPVADPSGSTGTPREEGGTPTPQRALLDWQPLAGSVEETVIDAGEAVVTVPQDGSEVRVDDTVIPAGRDRRVDAVLVPADGTVVVAALDRLEERPIAITVVDLASGETHAVTSPEPAPFGEVTAYDGEVQYATLGEGGGFCLARAPLDGPGEVAWCAEPRSGFNHVLGTDHGLALQTFDDRRPVACRSLATLDGDLITPMDGVTPCTGMNVALTEDGAVWSTIPQENRIEVARFHARAGDATYDLGLGNTDSLLPCGDSLWFTRDAGAGHPAQLLRWTPDATLEIAFEGESGEGFVEAHCAAGRTLTVAAYAEGGDALVSATLPS